MFIKRVTCLPNNFATILIGLLTIVTIGCSDNSTSSNGESNGENITVKGEISDYENGENELYASEDFVDLIEGTIETDGSFTVDFLGDEKIEEALKPVSDDTEGFVSMYCRESIIESLDSDHLFVDVRYFNFTYGEDTNVGGITLSSSGVNRNVYPPTTDTDGDYQIRWIYSSQEASISTTCEDGGGGTEEVDLELTKGWNEVIFDVSNRESVKMYTGERPAEVEWVVEY